MSKYARALYGGVNQAYLDNGPQANKRQVLNLGAEKVREIYIYVNAARKIIHINNWTFRQHEKRGIFRGIRKKRTNMGVVYNAFDLFRFMYPQASDDRISIFLKEFIENIKCKMFYF